ncbi:MAG TPA: NYN domain-containing protein [bacterium]
MPPAGYLLGAPQTKEPPLKRCYAFFDGQNLYHSARKVFGCAWPDYDPLLLSAKVCRDKDWNLIKVLFYTGIPDRHENPFWNRFWVNKLAAMGTRGVRTYSRTVKNNREKGIDLRLEIDVVRMAITNQYDVALIFSQDQDFTEAVETVKEIARLQNRWIWVASAFPYNPMIKRSAGIMGTEMIRIDKTLYDACIDPAEGVGGDYACLRLMHAGHMQLGLRVCLCANPCNLPSSESNLLTIMSKKDVSLRSYLRKTAYAT